MLATIKKAVAALLAGLTPGTVVALLAVFGVDLSVEVVAPVLGALSPLLAAIGAYLARNEAPAAPERDLPSA